MIAFKQGVRFANLQPQLVLGLLVIHSIWERYACGTLTITSGSDGVHKANSRHYSGNACDLRSRNLSPTDITHLVNKFKEALGSDFDIVIEPTHIHVEYDPK